ncbi:MAG: hypothetical protein OQK99_02810 [Gammaproteobacteria bacterium]|jgi:hypothetical protein|nr:hypothetical protein [Gammaproteobacteria bacterium]
MTEKSSPESALRRFGTVGSRADAELFGEDLTVAEHANLIDLDNQLHQSWALGEKFVLGWAPSDEGIAFLIAPHYFLADQIQRAPRGTISIADSFYRELVSSPKQQKLERLEQMAQTLGLSVVTIPLQHGLSGRSQETDSIERIIRRYGINYSDNRAVALFDIVGFSLLTPFEQMTQLNSLSYSLNSAHSRMLSKKIDIRFARSNTGDGFYIWNRDEGDNANTNLYHFMHLVLADNAIARRKGKTRVVPILRTCFHLGSCYEFYQAESLSPMLYSYLVGDVTIELARMVDKALPGQIMVGEFRLRQQPSPESMLNPEELDAIRFVDIAQEHLTKLNGLELAGEPINSIKCYLTGQPVAGGGYDVRRMEIHDKHGIAYHAFNAKVNIYRQRAEPIYLGIEDRSLGQIARLDS